MFKYLFIILIFVTACDKDENIPFELYRRPPKAEHYFTSQNEGEYIPGRPGEILLVSLERLNQPYKRSIEESLYDSGDENNRGTDVMPFFIPREENINFRVESENDITFKLFRDNGEEVLSLTPGQESRINLSQGDYRIELSTKEEYIPNPIDTSFIPIFIQPDIERFNEIGYEGNSEYRPQDVFILIASNKCVECDFSSAEPDSSFTKYADLSNSDLRATNFKNNIFVGANFKGSNLSYINLTEIAGRELGETNLSNAKFFNCIFNDADLSRSFDLSHTNFKGSDMINCDLSGSYGLYISFEGANLSYATLDGLFSRDNDFAGTNFFQASLVGAVIRRSEFNWTFMKFSNFDFANISDSKIENTWVEGMSIKGTNLCGSSVRALIFENEADTVIYDETTLCDSLFTQYQ